MDSRIIQTTFRPRATPARCDRSRALPLPGRAVTAADGEGSGSACKPGPREHDRSVSMHAERFDRALPPSGRAKRKRAPTAMNPRLIPRGSSRGDSAGDHGGRADYRQHRGDVGEGDVG